MEVWAPTFSDADFLAAFQALLPTGPVWPRDPDAVLAQTLGGLVPTVTTMANRASNLLYDAFPTTPVELLHEWEETLGLPDPCAGLSPTLQTRQQQVAARFVATGGQSVNYFINVALQLGYPITITQFSVYRVGEPIGQPISGAAWAFAWQVNAPQIQINSFQVGRDAVGEPLATWTTSVLQCELQRLAPAHTTVLFSFSNQPVQQPVVAVIPGSFKLQAQVVASQADLPSGRLDFRNVGNSQYLTLI